MSDSSTTSKSKFTHYKTGSAIEIKSTDNVSDEDAKVLHLFADDFPEAEMRVWSRDEHPKQFGRVRAVYWLDGLKELYKFNQSS